MLARSLELRGFRNLDRAEVCLGDAVTVVHGPNGAGKTNLLEALCVGLTGASWRTRSDRELVGFGQELARVEVAVHAGGQSRRFATTVVPGEGRRQRIDGAAPGPDALAQRPAVAIFTPDRLSLVKGPPAERRRHLDRFVAALWPARAELRRRFGRALGQRNALLGRIRTGSASEQALTAWDSEFSLQAAALVEARQQATDRLSSGFASIAGSLGLPAEAALVYRSRTGTADAERIEEQLRERRAADLERGYSTHGPHLDELHLAAGGRALRRYGSQGEQRVALLALVFAQRAALLEARRIPPLLLLDDVMSELDAGRRSLLVELVSSGGQAVLTATEASNVPDRGHRDEVGLRGGRVVALAAA